VDRNYRRVIAHLFRPACASRLRTVKASWSRTRHDECRANCRLSASTAVRTGRSDDEALRILVRFRRPGQSRFHCKRSSAGAEVAGRLAESDDGVALQGGRWSYADRGQPESKYSNLQRTLPIRLPIRLPATAGGNNVSALEGRIQQARVQPNDWTSCVSAKTPKGQAAEALRRNQRRKTEDCPRATVARQHVGRQHTEWRHARSSRGKRSPRRARRCLGLNFFTRSLWAQPGQPAPPGLISQRPIARWGLAVISCGVRSH